MNENYFDHFSFFMKKPFSFCDDFYVFLFVYWRNSINCVVLRASRLIDSDWL